MFQSFIASAFWDVERFSPYTGCRRIYPYVLLVTCLFQVLHLDLRPMWSLWYLPPVAVLVIYPCTTDHPQTQWLTVRFVVLASIALYVDLAQWGSSANLAWVLLHEYSAGWLGLERLQGLIWMLGRQGLSPFACISRASYLHVASPFGLSSRVARFLLLFFFFLPFSSSSLSLLK